MKSDAPQINYVDLSVPLGFLTRTLQQLTGLTEVNKVFKNKENNLPPNYLLISKPGTGKTTGVRGVVNAINTELEKKKGKGASVPHVDFISLTLGSLRPEDVNGTQVVINNELQLFSSKLLPVQGKDSDYGVLLLDEVTSIDNELTQTVAKLTDSDRGSNGYRLPPNWVVVLAGNDAECSNFRQLSTQLVNRCLLFNIRADFEHWKKWAVANEINSLVLNFLSAQQQPTAVLNCDLPEDYNNMQAQASASSRSWVTLSTMLYAFAIDGSDDRLTFDLAASCVGAAFGRAFSAFAKKAYLDAQANNKPTLNVDDVLKGTAKVMDLDTVDLLSGLNIVSDKLNAMLATGDLDAAASAADNVAKWVLSYNIKDFSVAAISMLLSVGDSGQVSDLMLLLSSKPNIQTLENSVDIDTLS